MTSETIGRPISLMRHFVWDAGSSGGEGAFESGPTENQKAFEGCGNLLWRQLPFSRLSAKQASNRRLMHETYIASQFVLEQAHRNVDAFLLLLCRTIAPNGNDADVVLRLFPKFKYKGIR